MPKTRLPDTLSVDRSRFLNKAEVGEGPVVYWMSREQRVQDNWALLHAQKLAVQNKKPLIVAFCLTLDYPAANLRHYSFLLEGLKETAAALETLRIPFFLLEGDPTDTLPAFLKECDAGLLVCDFDPLKIKIDWKRKISAAFSFQVIEVDGHNIIPCWIASDKQEYAAYTFRPKVARMLEEYLTDLPAPRRHPVSLTGMSPPAINWKQLYARIPDQTVEPVKWLAPGFKAASRQLARFIKKSLADYVDGRNDPNRRCQSDLSPYLHFGHISAQRIALSVRESKATQENKDAFLEELIVRRELADNFCLHNPDYDSTSGFPAWASKSHDEHCKDKREYLYDLEELEKGNTHDPLWNAAQKDMVVRGKLHGYLRMYWAKKILEWTDSPEMAMRYALYLNDKYELDGRDPNGYTGVAWSIGGVHDRAWPERPVFGKIRYMNANGCARKFNVKQYVQAVADMQDNPE